MSLLAFRQVSKRFPDGTREIAVLDRVSFEVHPGEHVGLVASRRAGKSTLLKIAAGLLRPDEGEVMWEGELDFASADAHSRARARRCGGVALARGDWRTVRSLSVLQHVALPLYSAGLTMVAAERRARRTLELVGASHLWHRGTADLGIHERLVVELARAAVREPRLLLVDEPAVLPQPQDAREFYELLRSLAVRLECALVIASEETGAVKGCKPVLQLSDGKLHGTASRRKVIDFPGGGRPRPQGA